MTGFWSDRSIYLTGGTGFIGTELVRTLRDRGARVTCLTRRRSRGEHLEELGCEVVEGDVTDPSTLEIPGDVDTVVHGAAWVAFGVPRQKRETFWATNVTGTENVLALARDAGVERFCHISSVAAVGSTPAGLYTEERAVQGRAPVFGSLYEESKHAAHVHVLENHGKMETTLPMPGVVLGLGSDTEQVLRAYAAGKAWTVRGDNPTAFVHVRDVVEGVVAAIRHGEGPYILVDENLTVEQLMMRFEEASGIERPTRALPVSVAKAASTVLQFPYHLMGKVPPASRELAVGLELPFTYSSERARKELKWEPQMLAHLREDFQRIEEQRSARGS